MEYLHTHGPGFTHYSHDPKYHVTHNLEHAVVAYVLLLRTPPSIHIITSGVGIFNIENFGLELLIRLSLSLSLTRNLS